MSYIYQKRTMTTDKRIRKTSRTSSMRRPPRTVSAKPGRELQYWVLELYLDEEKTKLLKREIFDTSAQVAKANPHIFKTRETVLNFRKRHSKDVVKKKRFNKSSLEIHRRIKLYRQVYMDRVVITAKPFLTK